MLYLYPSLPAPLHLYKHTHFLRILSHFSDIVHFSPGLYVTEPQDGTK